MRITGIGTDIIEIERIKKSVSSQHFLDRVYTEAERQYASTKNNPYQTYAGMFAAKEAAVKAMGGSIYDYEVLHEEDSRPYLNGQNALLSISHCEEYAVAFVTAFAM